MSPPVTAPSVEGSIVGVTSSACESAYESALRRLPAAYADALRLTEAATPEDEICRRLGIEPEGLDTFVELARRKLQRELTQK